MELCERFVQAYQTADDLLVDIFKQKLPIQLSLQQLSKLHHLQRQLEQFKFLNIVYSESTRMRKVFSQQANQQLSLQKDLCASIDRVLQQFLDHFSQLDRMILHIINMQLTHSSFLEILKQICRVIFSCEEFQFSWNDGADVLNSNSSVPQLITSTSPFIKTKFAKLTLIGESTPFAKQLRESLDTMQKQIIIDQLVIIIQEHTKEVFQREPLVMTIRGAKSIAIKNAQVICQQILKCQIESILKTQCKIHQKNSPEFEGLKSHNEVNFLREGVLIMPVKFQNVVQFYFETENIMIDIITFSDYLQQCWQNLTYHVRDLKQQEFLHQMIEVNTPNKLFLGVNENFEIVYQSGSVPASWSFLEMPQIDFDRLSNLKEVKMEQVYKKMLTEKILDLKNSPRAAIECGQIYFADRQVDIDIFVRRNEADQNPLFYVVFDQPKKKIDENGIGMYNIKNDLAIEVLAQLKNEKLEKACNILREQLNINIDTEEICEILREKEIENEMLQEENITQEIRDSYVIEYYKTDARSSNQQSRQMTNSDQAEIMSPYRTQKFIRDQQLNSVKKLELFNLDIKDYNELQEWEFTTINLPQENTSERIRLVWAMFQLCNYNESFQIKSDTFYQFLVIVLERYNCRNNPFHNFDHAIQVAHACYYFVKHKMMNQYLEPIEQFAALLSCLCHDLDHTGRTNGFEMARKSKLAIRYNDESVLENHHVSTLFKITSRESCNILSNIGEEQAKIVRKFAIANILATDMKRHFELIKLMELKIAKMNETGEPMVQKEDDKKLISGVFTHICDLAGTAKEYKTARSWSYKICQEFTSQVDEEMSLGLPVTSYLQNLTNPLSIAKNEISFIKVIVRPLYELAVQLAGSKIQVACTNLEQNQKQWEQVLQH